MGRLRLLIRRRRCEVVWVEGEGEKGSDLD